MVFSLCYSIRCFGYAKGVDCAYIYSSCQLVVLPSGLLTPHATPLFFSMNDSDEICARSSRKDGVLDPSVGAAIQSAVSESMGSLADNLTQVIESRLSDFATRFSEENSSSVEHAVKRARREHYTCKRKGNQQQLASSSRFSSVDVASRSEARPARRLGPCFKISSLLFSFYWLCFYFVDYGVTLRP